MIFLSVKRLQDRKIGYKLGNRREYELKNK